MVRCEHVEILEVTSMASLEREGICSNCPANFLADRNGGPWVRVDITD